MANRNCPNCSAPYDVTLSKCPYCGTSYFDMSAIDIGDCQPFYLKLKYYNTIITSKVIALPSININMKRDFTSICDYSGRVLYKYPNSSSMDIDVTFRSVGEIGKPDEPLATIERIEEDEE